MEEETDTAMLEDEMTMAETRVERYELYDNTHEHASGSPEAREDESNEKGPETEREIVLREVMGLKGGEEHDWTVTEGSRDFKLSEDGETIVIAETGESWTEFVGKNGSPEDITEHYAMLEAFKNGDGIFVNTEKRDDQDPETWHGSYMMRNPDGTISWGLTSRTIRREETESFTEGEHDRDESSEMNTPVFATEAEEVPAVVQEETLVGAFASAEYDHGSKNETDVLERIESEEGHALTAEVPTAETREYYERTQSTERAPEAQSTLETTPRSEPLVSAKNESLAHEVGKTIDSKDAALHAELKELFEADPLPASDGETPEVVSVPEEAVAELRETSEASPTSLKVPEVQNGIFADTDPTADEAVLLTNVPETTGAAAKTIREPAVADQRPEHEASLPMTEHISGALVVEPALFSAEQALVPEIVATNIDIVQTAPASPTAVESETPIEEAGTPDVAIAHTPEGRSFEYTDETAQKRPQSPEHVPSAQYAESTSAHKRGIDLRSALLREPGALLRVLEQESAPRFPTKTTRSEMPTLFRPDLSDDLDDQSNKDTTVPAPQAFVAEARGVKMFAHTR